MTSTYLSFAISNELYAIKVNNVLEVLQKQEITKVPNAPHGVSGIINFRGEIVPIFDSRAKFNLPETDFNASFVIVVLDLLLNNESFKIGAIVDKVKDVIDINDKDIKPVPPMDSEFNSEFIDGISRVDNKFTLLLNAQKVFTKAELSSIKLESPSEV
jgi:purine-binding chemotaxis protein CheW